MKVEKITLFLAFFFFLALPHSSFAQDVSMPGNGIWKEDGNVGIGTTSPSAALTVGGDMQFGNNGNRTITVGFKSNGGPGSTLSVGAGGTASGTGGNLYLFPGTGDNAGNTILGHNGNIPLGNVGIGTTSPVAKLDVFSNGSARVLVGDTCSAAPNTYAGLGLGIPSFSGCTNYSLSGEGTNVFLNAPNANGNVYIRTGNYDRMIVNGASGNVGVGTTNPVEKLDVSGNVRATNFITSSDERLKTNITPLTNALDKILTIQAVRYDFKTEPSQPAGKGQHIGFIAQNVEKQYPELVTTESNGYKAVAYDKMTPVLLEAIREQQKEIDQLREEIKVLQSTKK